MTFFGFSTRKEDKSERGRYQMSDAVALGERVASLINRAAHTPNMVPSGPEDAAVYVLGEAPGQQEDIAGEPFVGASGKLLRYWLGEWSDHTRMSNICRTRPPENRDPTQFEIEAYRQSVEQDLIAARPKVVFLVGRLAALWLIPEAKGAEFMLYRGSPFVAHLGDHSFWAVPLFHPAYVIRMANDKKVGTSIKDQFRRDIYRGLRLANQNPPKVYHASDFFDAESTILLAGRKGDLDKLEQFVDRCIAARSTISCDLETAGSLPYGGKAAPRPYTDDARILTAGFAAKGEQLAVALEHPQAEWPEDELKSAWRLINRLLTHKSVPVVWHNAQYDLEWIGHRFGHESVRPNNDYKHWHCTMAQAYTLDHRNTRGKGHGLDFLARRRLGTSFKKFADIDRSNLINEEVFKVMAYNAADCAVTRRLYLLQRKDIKREKLVAVYDHQRRRLSTMVQAQLRGIPTNQKRAKRLRDEYEVKIKEIESRLRATKAVREYERQYGPFKPSKNQDQHRLFRHIVGIDMGRGKGSLEAESLQHIDDPCASIILEHRKASKLLSTYISGYCEDSRSNYIFPGRKIHPVLNSTFTRTGRLSADSPNLQNQPKRDKIAKQIRRIVKPKRGWVIVSNDYGQIEWRAAAMASGDEYMIHAIKNGIDVHARWATKIANRFDDIIEKRYGSMDDPGNFKGFRAAVKNQMVFPAIYLAHCDYIARLLGVPEVPFRKLFDQFWDELAGVKRWQEWIVDYYSRHGYIHSLTGRKYYCSANRPTLTKNDVANYPIQGTAGDICIDAMCRISERAQCEEITDLCPVLQIHDDLTFVMPASRVNDYVKIIVSEMLNCPYDFINVPLQVETSVGSDWSNQLDVGQWSTDDWEPEKLSITIPDKWSNP